MINHIVQLNVVNIKSEQIYDFMINPSDERYSEWWPGEHLQFHIVKHGEKNHLNDEVFMDEYIGENRRLTFLAIVIKADKPITIIWQMKKAGIRLPAFVELNLHDVKDGVRLKHELRIGYSGIGRLLDPFILLYFNKSYQNALEKHCNSEWHMLAEYL
jgi:hypothetical protein